MATIRKKRDKWCVEIRRSFHKHISKTFISKQAAKILSKIYVDDKRIGKLAKKLIN